MSRADDREEPNPKHQIPKEAPKHQDSKSKARASLLWRLELGISLELGVWNLGFFAAWNLREKQ
jgi:hypothetical protein